MSIFRRPQRDADAVDVSARLAGYEATSTEGLDGSYASGYTFERRPSAATEDCGAPGHIAAPADVHEERRAEARHDLQLPARAKSRSEDEWLVGATVDASMTGLCLEMPCPPDEAHLDVELDSTEKITAWARVVGVTPVADGVFRWRLRLVSYDASYAILIGALDPTTSIEDQPATTTDPAEDERVLADATAWDELLHHASA